VARKKEKMRLRGREMRKRERKEKK